MIQNFASDGVFDDLFSYASEGVFSDVSSVIDVSVLLTRYSNFYNQSFLITDEHLSLTYQSSIDLVDQLRLLFKPVKPKRIWLIQPSTKLERLQRNNRVWLIEPTTKEQIIKKDNRVWLIEPLTKTTKIKKNNRIWLIEPTKKD